MKRLFLAIPIPPEEVKRLSVYMDGYKKDPHFRDAKWVEPQNLHITTLFLGDVQDMLVPEMTQLLRGFFARIPHFELHAESAELYPFRSPKNFWIRYHKSFEFMELTQELKKLLFTYLPDLEHEKEQIPHLTLARLKNSIDARKFPIKSYKAPPLLVQECRLYESTLTSQGPIYTVIESFSYAVS